MDENPPSDLDPADKGSKSQSSDGVKMCGEALGVGCAAAATVFVAAVQGICIAFDICCKTIGVTCCNPEEQDRSPPRYYVANPRYTYVYQEPAPVQYVQPLRTRAASGYYSGSQNTFTPIYR